MSLFPSFFQVLHAVCLSLPFFQVVHFVTSFVIVIMIGVGVHKPTLDTVTMVPPVPGTGGPVPNMTGPRTCRENMQVNQTKTSVIR